MQYLNLSQICISLMKTIKFINETIWDLKKRELTQNIE